MVDVDSGDMCYISPWIVPLEVNITHGIQLGDSSDKCCSVYSRAAFMAVIVVNPKNIIQGCLLYRPRPFSI